MNTSFDKTKHPEIILFISLIFVSLIFMGLDKITWLNWLKRPVERLGNPVKQKIYLFKKKLINKITPQKINDGDNQLKSLENENAVITAKLNNLEQENISMKKLLGVPLPGQWKFIQVHVLNIKNGIMTIDKGFDDGIAKNQTVIVENFLVGYVTEVNPSLSRVILPTAPKNQIKVKILTSNKKGIVKTDGSGHLILNEVLQEVNLSKGQIVVTTGEEEIYPVGLLIGKISSINKQASEVYQQAILEPFLEFENLAEVFVVYKR